MPGGKFCGPGFFMNARQLEVFRSVMREGSLTAAANLLGVSQPAISKVLHHLEDQLGYLLFERVGGRLIPTAEAFLLIDDADRVFRELEVLKDLARRVGERKAGLLRLGAALPVVQSVLPGALEIFRKDHPEVLIHLHGFPAREIAEALRSGAIDIGLTLSPILSPTVRTQTLTQVPLKVLVRADDGLITKSTVFPEDLAGRPLISYGSHAEAGAALDEAFRARDFTRTVSIQVTSSVAAVPLVAQGLGVGLVDGLSPCPEGLVALPFEPECSMPLVVSLDSARPRPRLVDPFLTALSAQL